MNIASSRSISINGDIRGKNNKGRRQHNCCPPGDGLVGFVSFVRFALLLAQYICQKYTLHQTGRQHREHHSVKSTEHIM